MKRKLRLFYFGLMCLFMFSTVLKAKAKETNSEDSYAFITASYSSNITPQEGDTFVITYKAYNGEDTAEITLDAYSICKNKVEIPLPEGHDTGGLPGSKTGRRFNRFRTPDCAVYRSKNG